MSVITNAKRLLPREFLYRISCIGFLSVYVLQLQRHGYLLFSHEALPAIPLFVPQFLMNPNDFRLALGLVYTACLVSAFSCVGLRFARWTLLLVAISEALAITLGFSQSRPFAQMLVIGPLFLFACRDMPIYKCAATARLCLGLAIAFTGIHKLLNGFIVGAAFQQNSSFFGLASPLGRVFISLLSEESHILSGIAVFEVIVGALIVLNYRIGISLFFALLFLLGLTVQDVWRAFLCILPFYFYADPRFAVFLVRNVLRLFRSFNYIAWVVLGVSFFQPVSLPSYKFFTLYIINGIFPLIAQYRIRFRPKTQGFVPRNVRWSIVFALLTYCMLPTVLHVPEPLSMQIFSGYRERGSMLYLQDKSVCREFRTTLFGFGTSFSWTADGCEIAFASNGAKHLFANYLDVRKK